MTVRENGNVEHEVRVAAAPETVFSFFVDSGKMARWFGRAATLEPRRGGPFRVEINDQAVALGEYVEVDAPRRVVFTFGWEGSPIAPGSSTVEVTLTPDGDGTIVRLSHRDLPEPARKDHDQGWGQYVARLAMVAEGKDAGPDPNAQAPTEARTG